MIYKFKTHCSKAKLRDVRSFVNKVLQEQSIPEIEINKLVLAVDEICANLMIHSHDCNPKDTIELLIKVKKDDGIIFEIIDKGIGFNTHSYKEPTLQEIVREKKKGGLGLMLVKRIMDQVEFKTDRDHNVCILYKKLKPC